MHGRPRASKPKPEKPRRFRIRPAYVILVALLALFAFKFVEKTQEIRQLARQEAALRYQNRQTAQQNAQLQRSIRYFHTSRFVEDEARRLLGYTKQGEVVIESQATHQPAAYVRPAPTRPAPPSLPIWKQWWQAFFG